MAMRLLAATARVIWLCACVRYCPDRGLVLLMIHITLCNSSGSPKSIRSGRLDLDEEPRGVARVTH